MPPLTTRARYWGPMFPDVYDAGKTYWSRMFPDPGPDPSLVPPTGPSGVATLMLDFDGEVTVDFEFKTDILKSKSGKEHRTAMRDHAKRTIDGDALLLATTPRAVRAQLQRFSSYGSPFLVGLPFEEATLVANSNSTTVYVTSAIGDWINPGQRVLVASVDRTTVVEATIQSVSTAPTPDTITLDVDPGVAGLAGGSIMPAIAIYLDPQQGFIRYPNPTGPERWTLKGESVEFGFRETQSTASIDLEAAAVAGGGGSGALAGALIQHRFPGAQGNGVAVAFVGDWPSALLIDLGDVVEFHFNPGTTTVGDALALLAGHPSLEVAGSYTSGNVLQSTDTFSATLLSGGSDGDYIDDGVGASVTTFASRPVWDRGVDVDGSVGDSLQAMNDLIDLGGTVTNVGETDVPDWGRSIEINRPLAEHWQWFKKFISTVRGRQRAFWLPTFRQDLTPVSVSTNTLTIEGVSDTTGAFFSWWPSTRDSIQVTQADGTVTRATITDAVDNGDGTIDLTIGTTLSGSAITMVSWLELCRFEQDIFSVTFKGSNFSYSGIARVVQQ